MELGSASLLRRETAEGGEFEKINRNLLPAPGYLDTTAVKGKTYYYTVSAVNSKGDEARFPREIRVDYAELAIVSVVEDTEGKPKKAGETIHVTLTGTPGGTATFDDHLAKATRHHGCGSLSTLSFYQSY